MTAPVVHGDLTPLYMQPTTNVNDPAQICYGAADFRLLVATVFPAPGVMSLTDWTITANTSAILGIGIGSAIVAGTTATEQRSYVCRNTAAKTIQPPGPPASANRYDLICLTAHDGQITGDSIYEWQVQCLSGSEAASPVVPTLPKDSIPLAAALRRPGAANIAAADLTDLRSIAKLPVQPQSTKYWHSNSSAVSPAFTATEAKDSSLPNITLVVTNANTIYRLVATAAIQSGHADNQCAMYIRDGGSAAPITTSTLIAGATVCPHMIGSTGAESLTIIREMSFAVGTHVLGVFGKIISGTSTASYLIVPSGGQKLFSVEIVG